MKAIFFFFLISLVQLGYTVEVETPCEASYDEKVVAAEETVKDVTTSAAEGSAKQD